MSFGLITLPLRLGLGAARVAVGVSERAVSVAWQLAESLLAGRGSDGAADAAERPRSERPPSERPPSPASESASEPGESSNGSVARDPRAEFELGDPRVDPRPAPPEPRPLAAPEPPPEPPEPAATHVSEEAVLVESFAEPGSEDGAGAEVRIEEPWEGYAGLNASEITGRLADASAAELAAVELYETAHKARTTVLAAVRRQLKARTAGAGET